MGQEEMVTEEQKAAKAQRLGHGLGDGNGLSWSSGYARVVGAQVLNVAPEDRLLIRELAKQVAEIAARPEQAAKRELWHRHNALQETMPLIFCDPEAAWYEIIPADQLHCQGDLARVWEFRLLKEVYWADEIKDDRVIEPCFRVHHVYDETGWGLEVRILGGENDGSYRWESPLHDYADLDKMRFRQIQVDYEKTHALSELASEVLGDILQVRLEGAWWWSLGMTSDLILVRGFERALYDLYDHPDGFHRLMAFLRDENLAKLDFLEANGLLSPNNGGDFIGTGGYGWSRELPAADSDGETVRTRDMWGFCESQETVGVSPQLFEEFVFAYQLPILERFGLNIYGCCEPLDRRWDIIKRIPRLRKVTVSPWSDVRKMAEKLGPDYIYCRKVNPAPVSTPEMDEEGIRATLQDTFVASYRHHCPAEVLLRDMVTVSWNPGNVIRWTQMAREEAARIYQ